MSGPLEVLRSVLREMIKGTRYEGKVYLAGGCVRDHLLHRKTNDFDLTVALPEGGIDLANYLYEAGKASAPVIYESFGTAMIYLNVGGKNSYKLELVMTRRESYRPRDRKPKVEYGTLEEDVLRRDFTINSLLMAVDSGEILDLGVRGRQDLKDGIIRTVAEPSMIFTQDPLRLLRAVRYASDLGFEIEAQTLGHIKQAAASLQDISQERIAEEMNRILVLDAAAEALILLRDTGLLRQILPEVQELVGLQQNRYHHLDAFEHSIEVIRNCRSDLLLRWAAILHDVGKAQHVSISARGTRHFYGHEKTGSQMAGDILKRFSLGRSMIELICRMIADHMRVKQGGEQGQLVRDHTIRRLIHVHGEYMPVLLELIHADNLAHHPDHCLPEQVPNLRPRVQKLASEMQERRFSLTGMDIIAGFSIQSSPLVGKLLKTAEDAWLKNPHLTKEKLIKIIKEKHK